MGLDLHALADAANDLHRIADALEKIADKVTQPAVGVTVEKTREEER